MIYIHLDELPNLFTPFWGWTSNAKGFALARFLRADHFGNKQENLKDSVKAVVKKQAGLDIDGPIFLLTHLRYFGYVFNPLCMYYCYDKDEKNIVAIVAEVSNTPWSEKHCYVLTDNLGTEKKHHYKHPKGFHVSPFLEMDVDYHWRLLNTDEKLFIHLENRRQTDKLFDATMILHKEKISQLSLNTTLLTYPLMTLKIIIAIHYEALKLWLKGVKYLPYQKKESVEDI